MNNTLTLRDTAAAAIYMKVMFGAPPIEIVDTIFELPEIIVLFKDASVGCFIRNCAEIEHKPGIPLHAIKSPNGQYTVDANTLRLWAIWAGEPTMSKDIL